MAKKLIGLFIAAALILALVPASAFARIQTTPSGEGDAEIHEIHILGFEPPAEGEDSADHMNFYAPEDAHYWVDNEGVTWWDYEEDDVFDGVFAANVYYGAGMTVYAEEGYCFAEDCTFDVNGDIGLIDWRFTGIEEFNDTVAYIWTLPMNTDGETEEPFIPIREVHVDGFDIPPIAGTNSNDHMNIYVEDEANYTLCDTVEWWDNSPDVDDSFEGIFVAGTPYSMGLTLEANEGYCFARNCVIYVNGSTELADPMYSYVDNGEYCYVWTIPMEAVESTADPYAVTEVNVNGFTEPVVGMTGADLMNLYVEEGSHYELAEIEVYDVTDEEDWQLVEADTELQQGDLYMVGCTVVVEEGYYYADDCVFLANGEDSLVDPEWSGVFYGEVAGVTTIPMECTAEPVEDPHAIHEVIVDGWGTPEEGVIGIEHVFLTTPADVNYYIIYAGWLDETDQQQLWNEEHVFIAGHMYSEGCQIWADEGYYFADDCVFRTNDGEDILDAEWCYVDEENWICYMNTIPTECTAEPVEDPHAIHEVIVDGWGTPEEGVIGIEHVFLTTPADVNYYIIYAGWLDETDQQQLWNEEHVFIAGHMYSEGCQIWADEGYYFADDCVFRTNDGEDILDAEWCYVDEENWICYMNTIPTECEGAMPSEPDYGDINASGDINVADAILALRAAMGLYELDDVQFINADVNGSGDITAADAILILRYSMGLVDHFPVED